MKSQLSRAVWIALVLSVAVPRYAAAQDERRVELAGGYSLMRDYDGDATFPGGWFASVAADVAGPPMGLRQHQLPVGGSIYQGPTRGH